MGAKYSKLENRDDILKAIMADNPKQRKQLQNLRCPDMTLIPEAHIRPIHLAVISGKLDTVQYLCRNPALDINAQSMSLTPLHLAAALSTPEVVSELLRHPAIDVNSRDDNQRTPLMAAILPSDSHRSNTLRAGVAELIASHRQCSIELTDSSHFSALTYAAQTGNIEAAQVLLRSNRASVYSAEDLLGDIAVASRGGHTSIIALIMSSLSPQQIQILERKITELVGAAGSGTNAKQKHTGPVKDSNGTTLAPANIVSFITDIAKVKQLQNGHGGWNETYAEVMKAGLPGKVIRFDDDGDAVVDFNYLVSEQKDEIFVNPAGLILKSKDVPDLKDRNGIRIERGSTVSFTKLPDTFGMVKFFHHSGKVCVVACGQIKLVDHQEIAVVTAAVSKNGSVSLGSLVRVDVSSAELERLQTEQFGGWSASMSRLLGNTYTVEEISCKCFCKTSSPKCIVRIGGSDRKFWINPKALTAITAAPSSKPMERSDMTQTGTKDFRIIAKENLSLLKILGSGAFGTVFRAKWIATECAVKRVTAQDLVAGEEKERILNEAKLHSRLIHPNIIQFLGISLDDTSVYIVMKLVEGSDLHEIIFSKKMALTEAEKKNIVLQVTDAMRFLHDDINVVHQDMKPSNVMVEAARKHAYITDFGISRLSGQSAANIFQNVTQVYTTTASGTLPFMAPELLKPSESGKHLYRLANSKSDMYALAGTFAELLSSSPLYGNAVKDMMSFLEMKKSGVVPPAVELCPAVYRGIIRKSMDRNPDNRPSALQFIKEFE